MSQFLIAFTICLLIAGNLSINNRVRELDGISIASQMPTSFSSDSVITLKIVLSQRRLYVYQNGEEIASYPVAIGKKGWETPVGTWRVDEMLVDPAWTNFKTRKVVKPGKGNPMGTRWIGFWRDSKDQIGFHGTQQLGSLGKAQSHGCVRMQESHIQTLYRLVKIGTVVNVVA